MPYFLAPYERVPGNGDRPRRACSLARVLPPQRPGGPAPFDESEGMGGYAVALVLDEANAAAARQTPGILAVPDVPLIGRLGDALDAASRAELVDALVAQGYSDCRIATSVGTDIAHASMLSVLRFMCGERRKPRHDRETGEVVLDGPRQPTKPLPLAPIAGGAFPTTGILDSASRANEDPAVGWVDNVDGASYGGVKILSNRLRPRSGDSWDYFGAATYGPDSEVYWTDDVTANVTFYLRLVSIGTSSVDGYGLARTATTYSFIRLDNDADTVLGAAVSQANSAGDGSGLEVVGSTLTAYYRAGAGSFTSIGTRTDGTYTGAGRIAPYMTGGGASIYNIGGGTVTTAVTHTGESSSTWSFTASTAAVITRLGAATATYAFAPAVSATRTTFAASATALALSAVTAARVGHFGAAATPIAFTAATAGTCERLGASASVYTFAPAVVATRTVLGSSATPIVFTPATIGRVGHFGASATPIVLASTAAATRTTFGAAATPITFTPSAAAILTSFGIVAVPLVLAATTAGTRTTFGESATPIVVSFTTDVGATTGASSSSWTFAAVTAATRTTFGAATTPVVLTAATAGTRTTFSAAMSGLFVSLASSAHLTRFGAAESAIVVTISSAGENPLATVPAVVVGSARSRVSVGAGARPRAEVRGSSRPMVEVG